MTTAHPTTHNQYNMHMLHKPGQGLYISNWLSKQNIIRTKTKKSSMNLHINAIEAYIGIVSSHCRKITPLVPSIYCLFCVLRLIIKSGVLCTGVHLYTVIICTDGVEICIYPYMLSVTYAVTLVCVYMWIIQSYG